MKKSNNEDTSYLSPVIQTDGWFNFVLQVMSMKNDVDTDALTKEFDEEFVKSRKGDYGKILSYVPAKYIRERLNEVLGCKWSFFPLMEQRVIDPIPHFNKGDDEEKDSPKYLKVLGVLAIPGLGVQAQYGVKKTYGVGEANDWKAAATDAFKKCAAGFGIEADYDIEDDDSEESLAPADVDLDSVEYDEDELAEAMETEVNFGKYKEFTMDEIYAEDPDYLEWVGGNARDKDVRQSALIVLKYYEDKKTSKSKGAKKSNAKNSDKGDKTGKSSNKKSSKPEKSEDKKSTSSKSSKKPNNKDDDSEDDEKEELINDINEIFESSDEYDNVTIKELIKSISVSKKYPNGKKKIEELSIKELKDLAQVLMDDDEDDEDEEE